MSVKRVKSASIVVVETKNTCLSPSITNEFLRFYGFGLHEEGQRVA